MAVQVISLPSGEPVSEVAVSMRKVRFSATSRTAVPNDASAG